MVNCGVEWMRDVTDGRVYLYKQHSGRGLRPTDTDNSWSQEVDAITWEEYVEGEVRIRHGKIVENQEEPDEKARSM